MDGEREISIPAGIQNGEIVKIKNAGVPNISKPTARGEHVVVIGIKTPTHVSNEEKVLYKKLYEIQKNKDTNSVKERLKGVFK